MPGDPTVAPDAAHDACIAHQALGDRLRGYIDAEVGEDYSFRWGLAELDENYTAAGCPHGDPTCPCPDGDACHYRDYPAIEGRWPASKAMVCGSPDCTVKEPHERAVSPGWNDDLLDEVHTW